MKVLWVNNIPSPYKVDMMEMLGQKIDLTVLFEYKTETNREESWYKRSYVNFNGKYLNNWFLDAFKYAFGEYDLLIDSDYSTPFCILLTLLFRIQGKKVILQADGGIAYNRGWFLKKIISIVMSFSSFYLSSGKYTDDYFAYYGVNKERIKHYRFTSLSQKDINNNKEMRNGKDDLRKELNIHERIVFLSVGQQIYRKGYDILLKAIQGIEGIGVYIVGGKPEKDNEEFVRANNLYNVHFIDFCNKEKLSKYYAAADVFVFPTREDIWGLVINEAMSFGLPIVSSDNCVAAKEFNDLYDNCIIFPVDNYKMLHDILIFLVKNPNCINEMSWKSINGIKEYSLENMAKDYYEVIKEVVA